MLGHVWCLGSTGSVLLSTLEYFVKSSSHLTVDNLMTQTSTYVVFSPREREQFNRSVSYSLPRLTFVQFIGFVRYCLLLHLLLLIFDIMILCN